MQDFVHQPYGEKSAGALAQISIHRKSMSQEVLRLKSPFEVLDFLSRPRTAPFEGPQISG